MEAQHLFDLNGLGDLSRRKGVDMRPTLLRVLTDLYVQRLSHSADEERHYTELALRLLDAVDVTTRAAVARRFARYLSPPLRVLQRLARDLPTVAVELRAHPLLQSDAALTPRGAALAQALRDSRRVDVRRPPPAPTGLAAGTAQELNEFFFTANAEERRLILLNLHIAAPRTERDDLVAVDSAIGQDLEAAVLTGRREHFAARLAQALRIPHDQARRIANDELGEPVVVAGKALGLPRDVFYRILMFVNPAVGHSVERVHSLATLHEAIEKSAAEAMLAIWQALRGAEHAAAKHQPLAWDDSTRQPIRQSAATRRNPPAQTGERRVIFSNGRG